MYLQRNTEARVGKYTWGRGGGRLNSPSSQCVYADLIIQYGINMRRVTLQSVTCLAIQNFTQLRIKFTNFRNYN